jgi:hypothetical protein
MTAAARQQGFGIRRGKREVIDVPERKVEDKSLDKLLHVRKQRLERLERARSDARNAWRATRLDLREKKEEWRRADRETREFWQNARTEFFRKTITSGEVRKAKATYERMKTEAAGLRLHCDHAVNDCKTARAEFFAAREQALQANKQQEKLTILRDEMRLLNRQSEM